MTYVPKRLGVQQLVCLLLVALSSRNDKLHAVGSHHMSRNWGQMLAFHDNHDRNQPGKIHFLESQYKNTKILNAYEHPFSIWWHFVGYAMAPQINDKWIVSSSGCSVNISGPLSHQEPVLVKKFMSWCHYGFTQWLVDYPHRGPVAQRKHFQEVSMMLGLSLQLGGVWPANFRSFWFILAHNPAGVSSRAAQ